MMREVMNASLATIPRGNFPLEDNSVDTLSGMVIYTHNDNRNNSYYG